MSATAAPPATVKAEARMLLDRLPDDATWEDVEYAIGFRAAIEKGLRAADEGRVVPHAEVLRRLGLEP